jgi:hypothetical protein
VFDPSSGDAQITDFNPGVSHNGLFWTTIVDHRCVDADLGAGTATMQARGLHMKDYHDFENAILGNGAAPAPGVVSFTVRWTATGEVNHFDNPAQQYRADMWYAQAQMEWTARSGDFEYRSAPLAESTTDAAQFGFESNGSYY